MSLISNTLSRTVSFLTALFVMASIPVMAQAADKYLFDKSHTSILFFIDHLGFSKMVGEFHDYDGVLMLDAENPENSTLEVTIRPTSVDTDVPVLDKKLQGPTYFNTKEFPTARFVSTKIERTGENTAKVTGDFTMLGKTKPLTLDVTLNKHATHAFADGKVAGFTVKGELFRSAFGMTELLPAVGDKVSLHIETEFEQVIEE